jgi:hypothetical protein
VVLAASAVALAAGNYSSFRRFAGTRTDEMLDCGTDAGTVERNGLGNVVTMAAQIVHNRKRPHACGHRAAQ